MISKFNIYKEALADCCKAQPVLFADEVDIDLNPKLGADWMLSGHQMKMVTQRFNEEHYLAMLQHTARRLVTNVVCHNNNAALFISLLEALWRPFRRNQNISLILNNYLLHKNRVVHVWQVGNPRFTLVFLLIYSLFIKKIELLWHMLHEKVTHNQQCYSVVPQLKRVRHYMIPSRHFQGVLTEQLECSTIWLSYLTVVTYMILKKAIKLEVGALGSFNGETEELHGKNLRVIEHQIPEVVFNFPVLFSTSMMSECLDANLFLQHKYTGRVNYKNIDDKNRENHGETVQVTTIDKIANSLKAYLTYCEKQNLDIYDGLLNTFSVDQKQWLPPYRFKNHIIERVVSREIEHSTGNLLLLHVKQFYEWMYKTGRINKIPFNYKYVLVSKNKKKDDDELDFLFAPDDVIFAYKEKLQVQTSDLKVPRKHKSAKVKRENEPWSLIEMTAFFGTQHMQYETRRLWAELGFQVGLRAIEVTRLSDQKIVDPELYDSSLFDIEIIGKNNKQRTVLVPKKLMSRLFTYKNSAKRLEHMTKYKSYLENLPEHSDVLAYEKTHGRPLFINKLGRRISSRSVVNIVSKSRAELRDKGNYILEEPHFHGSRSTYATRLIKAMFAMEMPVGFIKWKVMELLGHNSWDTTLQHYVNMARGITYDEKLDLWVSEIYKDVEERLRQEKQELSK